MKIFWAFLARGHAGRRRHAMLEAMEADNGDQTLWLVEWWCWGGGVEFGMPGWQPDVVVKTGNIMRAVDGRAVERDLPSSLDRHKVRQRGNKC